MFTVIDARDGKGKPHDCNGSWDLLGRNEGGHEVYNCDKEGGHVLIHAHTDRGHECGTGCGRALVDIHSRNELLTVMRRLGIPANWHEPDQAGVSAIIHGDHLDNAGIYTADYAEFRMVILKDGQTVARVNLATLFAIASGGIG